MKQALLEHIEAKVMNFLHDTRGPKHASQIAVQIQEKRDDTLFAIRKLVENQTVKDVQDFGLFNTTGETTAYILADNALKEMHFDPSIPVPPQHRMPSSSRDATPGLSA